MKKYIGLMVMSVAVIIFSVFISSYASNDEFSDKKIEHSDVSQFLWDNVYPELDVLTPNNFNRSFSRCPSGFSQSLDEEKTDNTFAYGVIYNAEGCHREEFCEFKVNMVKKTAYLRNFQENEYLAMDQYIASEVEKRTAKF